MSDQKWWAGGSDEPEHYDDDTLFAFIRDELPDEKAREVQRHLNDCLSCWRRSYLIAQLTSALKPEMEREEQDISLTKSVLMHINNPRFALQAEQQRRRKQLREYRELAWAMLAYAWRKITGWKRAGRAISTRQEMPRSMPTTMLLSGLAALLIVVLVLGYSYSVKGIPSLSYAKSSTSRMSEQRTVIVPSHPTETPTPARTPASNSTSPSKQPVITICKSAIGKWLGYIEICGSNFAPHDKIQVWISTQPGKLGRFTTLFVKGNGQFQYTLLIIPCRNVPIAISVYDISQKSWVRNTIKNVRFGVCSLTVH